MISKERFLTAITMKGLPDRVPVFDNLFNKDLFRRTLGMEPVFTAKMLYNAAAALGLDSVLLFHKSASTYKKKYIGNDTFRDEWGAVVKEYEASWPSPSIVEFIIQDESDLKKINPPDPNRPERYEDLREVIETNGDQLAIGFNVGGPLTAAWSLMNPERILLNTIDNKELIIDIFKLMNDFTIPLGINAINAGIDCLWISEDLASNLNTYFSLDTYRELVHPFLEEMVKEFRHVKRDLPIIFHSCGNFKLFIDDYISLDIDAIHPFQKKAGWDLKEVKKRYGEKICIIGGVDATETLCNGTPEDVKNETIEALESAKSGGGFVLASDHSLHGGVQVENALEMIKTAKEYGVY